MEHKESFVESFIVFSKPEASFSSVNPACLSTCKTLMDTKVMKYI